MTLSKSYRTGIHRSVEYKYTIYRNIEIVSDPRLMSGVYYRVWLQEKKRNHSAWRSTDQSQHQWDHLNPYHGLYVDVQPHSKDSLLNSIKYL